MTHASCRHGHHPSDQKRAADLHAAIAEHARAQGLTISQYLLRRLAQIEGKPEIGRALDAHWSRSEHRKRAAAGIAAAVVAEDRQRSSMLVIDASALVEVLTTDPAETPDLARRLHEVEWMERRA